MTVPSSTTMDDLTVVESTRLGWVSARSTSNASLNSLDPTIVESTRLHTPPFSHPDHRRIQSNENDCNIAEKAMVPCKEMQQMMAHCLQNSRASEMSNGCDLFTSVFDSKASRMTLDCKHYFPK
jgi:hypothetical protein